MTTVHYSDSLAIANDFIAKLVVGTLNMRMSHEVGGTLVEVTRTTVDFTTKRIAEVRAALRGFLPSRLEATDIETDQDSLWSRSELRHITLHARYFKNGKNMLGKEMLLMTFDVHRDYLDGDSAEGWTGWRVKNVVIFLTDVGTELVPEYLNPDDHEPIWGTRVA